MRYSIVALLTLSICSVACQKNSIEYAQGKSFFLYPAVCGNDGDKNCQNFYGDCLYFQTPNPVMQLRDIKFQAIAHKNANNQIAILLDEKQSLELEKISEKYAGEGELLAIVYEQKILHAPKLRCKIKTDRVVIDFCNPRLYEIVLAVFRGQMPPNYSFNADPTVNSCLRRPKG